MTSRPPFYQQLPTLLPQYTYGEALSDDQIFAQVLDFHLPRTGAEPVLESIHELARRVLDEDILRHVVDAETNKPTLRPMTTFGQVNQNDPLVTSHGWKALKNIGIEARVVNAGYANGEGTAKWNRRVHQFGLIHVWTAASAVTMCPMSMTDGAASLLRRRLDSEVTRDSIATSQRAVMTEAYQRLISADPTYAWTSGQWMTERAGGSDVSGTETIASYRPVSGGCDACGQPLGPWSIDGAKWFSSATDSDMTVLLAKTPKGLSAFLAPIRRRLEAPGNERLVDKNSLTVLNGIQMQRLKSKMGTNAVPTAELHLAGTRAWLLGEEGQGIREIATVLNITRLHVMSSSMGNWGRALSVCRAYSRVRKIRGGSPTADGNIVHTRWFADETVSYAGALHFTFLCVGLLGHLESDFGVHSAIYKGRAEMMLPKDRTDCEALLRLLTPVGKARISAQATEGIRQAMECVGGVGYCENNEDGGWMNLARLFRDQAVNPIWEGTVSVMADDVVRVIVDRRFGHGKGVLEGVFVPWIRTALSTIPANVHEIEKRAIDCALHTLTALIGTSSTEELKWRGRQILKLIDTLSTATVLLLNAQFNEGALAGYVASRYVQNRWHDFGLTTSPETRTFCKEECTIDHAIFFGVESDKAEGLHASRL